MATKIMNICLKNISKTIFLRNTAKNILPIRQYSLHDKTDISNFIPAIANYEISKSKTEWQFVERLLPPLTVPKLVHREKYNTNWKPPTAKLGDYKYYINRNRNHLIPVYLKTTHRGMRKLTEVRKIHGDIYEMQKDLTEVIEKAIGKPVASYVNEMIGFIKFKGDYVTIIQKYLLDKGF